MKVFLYCFLYYLCRVESKRKQALLGSNLSGIDLTYTKLYIERIVFFGNIFQKFGSNLPKKTQHSFSNINPKKGQHISGQDKFIWQ